MYFFALNSLSISGLVSLPSFAILHTKIKKKQKGKIPLTHTHIHTLGVVDIYREIYLLYSLNVCSKCFVLNEKIRKVYIFFQRALQ